MEQQLQETRKITIHSGIPTSIGIQRATTKQALDISIPDKLTDYCSLKTSQDNGELYINLRTTHNRHPKCPKGKCKINIALIPERIDGIKINTVKGNIDINSIKCDNVKIKNVKGHLNIAPNVIDNQATIKLVQSNSDISIGLESKRIKLKCIGGETIVTGQENIALKTINSETTMNGTIMSGNFAHMGEQPNTDQKIQCEIINGRFTYKTQYSTI